jgi:hypothetical protein
MTINHLVLQIIDNPQTLNFYKSFFDLLNLEVVFVSPEGYYKHYENKNVSIGLYFEKGFVYKQKEYSGLGHIAFQLDKENYEEIIDFIKTQLEIKLECINEIKPHHGNNYLTTTFYCPSGIRIEIIQAIDNK